MKRDRPRPWVRDYNPPPPFLFVCVAVAEALLPTINGTLLSSQFEHYVATGVKVMLLVLKRHGNAIYNVLEGWCL